MAFVSIQKETLLTDIIKSWVYYLTNTGDFTGVTFRADTPDTVVGLTLPIIVLKRVSNDTWSNNRNGGYHGTNGGDVNTVNTLYGYTYSSLIQFDIMTTTITKCNNLQGFLYKALESSAIGSRTHIPLRTFAGNDNVGSPTDLQMKFYFQKDVDGAIIPSFDPSLHMGSISVGFSIDYLSEEVDFKILDTEVVVDLDTPE